MRRRIITTALRGKKSSREICDALDIDSTVSRVKKVLLDILVLLYQEHIQALNLSKVRMEEGLKFLKLNMK